MERDGRWREKEEQKTDLYRRAQEEEQEIVETEGGSEDGNLGAAVHVGPFDPVEVDHDEHHRRAERQRDEEGRLPPGVSADGHQ